MEYVHLGRSGLRVSRLCLGTMNFGPAVGERDADAIMDRALEAGINFLDTADAYGKEIEAGATERIIGRWLGDSPRRRDKIVLATKAYANMGDWPNEGRLSALHIRRACDASLERLNTDFIDLYQMHHIDRETPWEEIWQAMDVLIGQGKVVYVGSSNFAGWHIAQAMESARSRHSFGLVSEQSKYSLLCRSIELELLPACRNYGLGVVAWNPLYSGVLAGNAHGGDRNGRRGSEFVANTRKEHSVALQRYEELCRRLGHEPADVAMAWLLHNPAITAPIIGPRSVEQVEASLRALSVRLDSETLALLDEIFPGPGKPAPEAYAW